MRWIKGNHPEKTEFTGIVNSRKAIVRRCIGGKNPPTYNVTAWYGDRWVNSDYSNKDITHYMWIEEPLRW